MEMLWAIVIASGLSPEFERDFVRVCAAVVGADFFIAAAWIAIDLARRF